MDADAGASGRPAGYPAAGHTAAGLTGAGADHAGPSAEVSAEAAPGGRGPVLVWEQKMRLLTDPFILWEFVKVAGISAVSVPVLVLFVGWLTQGEAVILPWLVPVLAFAGMFVMMMVVSLLMGNAYRAVFELGAEGVVYRSVRRERLLGRAVFIAGALAGSATAAGAGALAASGEDRAVPWGEVRSYRVYPRRHVVVLKDSWHVLLRVYCPPALFDQVAAYVRARVEEVEAARRALSEARRLPPRPLWHRIVSAVGALALLGAARLWLFYDFDLSLRVGVLGGVLVAAACAFEGAPRRVFGLLGGVCVAWYAGGLALSALDPVGTSRAAVLDTPLLAVSALGTAGLLALAGWRLAGPEWGARKGPEPGAPEGRPPERVA